MGRPASAIPFASSNLVEVPLTDQERALRITSHYVTTQPLKRRHMRRSFWFWKSRTKQSKNVLLRGGSHTRRHRR